MMSGQADAINPKRTWAGWFKFRLRSLWKASLSQASAEQSEILVPAE